ncbi:hypothetical protein [Hominibacterium faecale]|uniref:hypothetical protein n=1 Tax=Hominibacterium faecale TaxID=2839743 RepID=UPI0022B2A907|nr:hypothetical protein [Hominibacterium faecale]
MKIIGFGKSNRRRFENGMRGFGKKVKQNFTFYASFNGRALSNSQSGRAGRQVGVIRPRESITLRKKQTFSINFSPRNSNLAGACKARRATRGRGGAGLVKRNYQKKYPHQRFSI